MIDALNSQPPNINIVGKSRWTKEDFEIGPCLGRGKFSEVFLARERLSGFVVALKIMKKSFLKEYGLEEQLRREIFLQNESEHPNILALYGFFHETDNIYLILEYAEQGDLFSLTNQFPEKKLPEKLAAKYILQTINALMFLHKKNIIHRDLKPENVLLSRGQVRVCDFGLAIEKTEAAKDKKQAFCGTLDYISPEMFQRQPHDYKVDVWSVGILAYELCAGKPPFQATNYTQAVKTVCQGKLKIPDYFSHELSDLLKKVLSKNPNDRPDFNSIIQFPWFKAIEKDSNKQNQ